MPPMTFNAAKHPLGLGAVGGTSYGVNVRRGSYQKRPVDPPARRIQIGESRWLQDSRLSEWVQDDFSGGSYQEVLENQKQVADMAGFLPSKRSAKALRSCQTLEVLDVGTYNAVESSYVGTSAPVAVTSGWGNIYLLVRYSGADHVYRIAPGTPNGTVTDWNVNQTGVTATAIGVNTILGLLVIGYSDGSVVEYSRTTGSATRCFFWAANTLTGLPARLRAPNTGPDGVTGKGVTAIQQFGTFMVVAFMNHVYYYAADDETTAGAAVHTSTVAWTKLGVTKEREVVAMCNHRNALYLLSTTASGRTAIDMTTLVAGILPWMDVPYLFDGYCLASYAGRLYVGGAGYDPNGAETYGELYEVSGNQFRQLHTYYARAGQVNTTTAHLSVIKSLVVAEGLLFFANSYAEALEAYDFVTDAFFTAYRMTSASDAHPNYVVTAGTQMYVLCHGGSSSYNGVYHVPQSNTHTVAPYVESSEFTVEPGTDKRWIQVVVQSLYTAASLSFSTNGGYSWTAATRTSVTQNGYGFTSRFDLPADTVSRTFKWRVTLDLTNTFTSSNYYYRELVSVVVGFLLQPPKQRQVSFVLAAVDNYELLDGVQDTTDPALLVAQLWTWYQAGTRLTLTDRDGTTMTVQVVTPFAESELGSMSTTAERELFMQVTLLEVVGA